MMHIFKRHDVGLIFAISLLVAAVACQDKTPPLASSPTLSPAPNMTSTPTFQPPPSPTDMTQTPAILQPEAPCLSCGLMEEQAREALANWLGVSSEEMEVLEVEEVEWPDTSLGCPQPGMVYAQVIVPGWKVVMRVDDEAYEYHSGGGHGVLCDEEGHLISVVPSPTATPITVPGVPTPTREHVCPMMLVFPHGRVCATPSVPGD